MKKIQNFRYLELVLRRRILQLSVKKETRGLTPNVRTCLGGNVGPVVEAGNKFSGMLSKYVGVQG